MFIGMCFLIGVWFAFQSGLISPFIDPVVNAMPIVLLPLWQIYVGMFLSFSRKKPSSCSDSSTNFVLWLGMSNRQLQSPAVIRGLSVLL